MLELVDLAASRIGRSPCADAASELCWHKHTAAQAAKPSPNRSIVRLSVIGSARFNGALVQGESVVLFDRHASRCIAPNSSNSWSLAAMVQPREELSFAARRRRQRAPGAGFRGAHDRKARLARAR